MNIYGAFPNNVVEEEFPSWFDDQIRQKSVKKDPTCTPELFSLAYGPNAIARSSTACLVNHMNEQDVIHGGTSYDVALSNEFPDLDDTVLSTNDESTEVDVPLDTEVCNDDDDDFIYDIDDVAHDIGSEDEMALSVAPSYHGGDAGGDLPERPNRLLPHQCKGSGQHGPTTLQALKTTYRKNNNKLLKVQFEYKDQKTFTLVGGYSSNLAEYFSPWESVEKVKQHMPQEDDWKKGQVAWEKQVDWWADLKRVEKSAKNVENRAKKRTTTYQGSKSFDQGRHEYFVKKGRYQDLITHERDKHSHKGIFDNSENKDLY
ncbi:hypothetical protein Tco_1416329, partial [Tanacetum coccineum]